MSTGMNATTGRAISGWSHVQQSMAKIMSTALNSRVMRRLFGSGLPRLVDRPLTPATILDFYAAMAKALAFEPRFKVTKIGLSETTSAGVADFTVTGLYYPRALAGDFSVAEVATHTIKLKGP